MNKITNKFLIGKKVVSEDLSYNNIKVSDDLLARRGNHVSM